MSIWWNSLVGRSQMATATVVVPALAQNPEIEDRDLDTFTNPTLGVPVIQDVVFLDGREDLVLVHTVEGGSEQFELPSPLRTCYLDQKGGKWARVPLPKSCPADEIERIWLFSQENMVCLGACLFELLWYLGQLLITSN